MNASLIRRPTPASGVFASPFDRMFEQWLGDAHGADGDLATFTPSLDVHETDKDIVVAWTCPASSRRTSRSASSRTC